MNRETVSGVGGYTLSRHMMHTFLWMTAGLAVTALVAAVTLLSGLWITIFSIPFASIILVVAELGVVIALTSRLDRMQVSTARILFLAYSVLTGITFSVLPLAYGISTMFIAFGFYRTDVWQHGGDRHDHAERSQRSGADSDDRSDHDDHHDGGRLVYRSERD